MAPSVRVKRRHAYASIHNDRYRPEQLHQLEPALSELGAASALLNVPLGSLPQPVPTHDPSHLSPDLPQASPRRDMSRVNRLARRNSVNYRSFATDLDLNQADSQAVPHPHRAYPRGQRISRVRNALPSSPSATYGSDRDSDSDSSDSNLDSSDSDLDSSDSDLDSSDSDLCIIDPATLATLTNTPNAIHPRKPVVTLPRRREPTPEGALIRASSTDELDRHVYDVFKRKKKFRRTMESIWAFLARAPIDPDSETDNVQSRLEAVMSLEHIQLEADSVLSKLQEAISCRDASRSLPPAVPTRDPSQISPKLPFPPRDIMMYLNPVDSRPATNGQLQGIPLLKTILEGTFTDSVVSHPHRAHPQRVSRVPSKNVKFPVKLLEVLENRLKTIAMGRDPGYSDQLLRRTLAVFYGQLKRKTFRRQMKENRKIEQLILMFATRAMGVLRSDPTLYADDKDKWDVELNNHIMQFVKILRESLGSVFSSSRSYAYDKHDVFDHLDVIDSRVATFANLTNAAKQPITATYPLPPPLQKSESSPHPHNQIYQHPANNSQTPHVPYTAGPEARPLLPPKEMVASRPGSDPGTRELKSVLFPRDCLNRFASVVSINTARNQETCGLLQGEYKGGSYVVTTLLIPKQHATGDTFTIYEEELVMQFTEERSLIILGWIHTHPTQSCFMSSIDLHMHSGFQRMLPESFAVVCAPNSTPNFGIFRLTDPGLQTIIECQATEAFHLHPEHSIYTDAAKGHVQICDLPLQIDDLREHTALLRKPFTLLSEDTLEFFKGSLSRHRHSEVGHIQEEEEEVADGAGSASERDETISEPGTPKERPTSLHLTPAPCSNVSHRSTDPSANHNNGIALPTNTSIQSETSVNRVFTSSNMMCRSPEPQFHDQQPEYLRMLQDKFGPLRPDRGHRHSCTDDASACNEEDGNSRESFVDPDNESCNSGKTVSKGSLFSPSILSPVSQLTSILDHTSL